MNVLKRKKKTFFPNEVRKAALEGMDQLTFEFKKASQNKKYDKLDREIFEVMSLYAQITNQMIDAAKQEGTKGKIAINLRIACRKAGIVNKQIERNGD